MRVSLALLADYANVSREGKLNIMGIFDSIMSSSVPTAHNQLQLVFTVEGADSESGTDHQMEIELQDPDKVSIFKVNGTIHFAKGPAGAPVKANSNIQMNNLIFKHFGKYCFRIIIDGTEHSKIPFTVVELKRQ